jgi:hypothetical protein
MSSETAPCFFCKGEIDLKKAESYVLLKVKDVQVHAHTSHKGVMEEYDRQLGVKKVS